jgi:hypothetical protein
MKKGGGMFSARKLNPKYENLVVARHIMFHCYLTLCTVSYMEKLLLYCFKGMMLIHC